MVRYSTGPLNAHARVRPCTAMAWIPATQRSARCAPYCANLCGPVQFLRSPMGTQPPLQQDFATSDSCSSSAARSCGVLFGRQPRLMSMMSRGQHCKQRIQPSWRHQRPQFARPRGTTGCCRRRCVCRCAEICHAISKPPCQHQGACTSVETVGR